MKSHIPKLTFLIYLILMLTSSVLADVIFEPSLLDPDSGWFSILIIVVLVVVLALATNFIIRRLKKKK